jgi:hypothetical protein
MCGQLATDKTYRKYNLETAVSPDSSELLVVSSNLARGAQN